MQVPTLQTGRLLLRAFARADIPALVPLIGAREVAATTLRIPHPYSAKDAEALFAATEAGDELRWAIARRSDGLLMGGLGMRLDSAHNHAELGYWLGVLYWGNGYATEAAGEIVRYGFGQLALHRIQASHFSNNPASGKVLRKIGMKHEGCRRQHIFKWGEYLDLELYGMVKPDNSPRDIPRSAGRAALPGMTVDNP